MSWALLDQVLLSSNPGDGDLAMPRHPKQTGRQRAAPWAGQCWSREEDGVSKGSALPAGSGVFPKGILVQSPLKPVEKLSQTPA